MRSELFCCLFVASCGLENGQLAIPSSLAIWGNEKERAARLCFIQSLWSFEKKWRWVHMFVCNCLQRCVCRKVSGHLSIFEVCAYNWANCDVCRSTWRSGVTWGASTVGRDSQSFSFPVRCSFVCFIYSGWWSVCFCVCCLISFTGLLFFFIPLSPRVLIICMRETEVLQMLQLLLPSGWFCVAALLRRKCHQFHPFYFLLYFVCCEVVIRWSGGYSEGFSIN